MNFDCVINDWLLDVNSSSLIHQQSGEQRRLGEYQFRLLLVLAEHAGQILSRDELNGLVWERRVIGNNSLPNAVHALRVALDDDGKHQAIIRTIPKKGYILEQAYCHFLQRESEQPAVDAAIAPEEASLATSEADLEAESAAKSEASHFSMPDVDAIKEDVIEEAEPTPLPAPAIVTPEKKPTTVHWRPLFFIQLVIFIALTVLLTKNLIHREPELRPQHQGTWSQIRIFKLDRPHNEANISREDFNKLLSKTLYNVNQSLETQEMKMDIYYFATGNALNYTMRFSNRCGQRELGMTIYRWRLNSKNLNTLISKETERKIDELAACHN